MQTARLHVAIPVRGVGRWLDAALESLQRQTFDDWTATIVVDADPDETDPCDEIARRWAADEARISSIHPGRVGLAPALNLGIAGSGAALIARFDGDDLCRPERFAQQVAFLDTHPDIDVLDSFAESFRDPTDGILPPGMLRYQHWHDSIEEHDDFVREFLVENPVCHPAVMLRRQALGRLDQPTAPYRRGDFPEDYDLWLRLLRGGARFHKLQQPLVRWRDHEQRATRSDLAYRKAAFFRTKWQHFAERILPEAGRIVVCGAKREGRRWIGALARAGHHPIAVADIDPRAIGNTRHGAPVVRLEELGQFRPDLALVAVGTAGARGKIERALCQMKVRCLAVAGIAG